MSSAAVHLGFAAIRFELVNDVVHVIATDRRSEMGAVDYVVAVTADDAERLLVAFAGVSSAAYRAQEARLNADAPAWGTCIEMERSGEFATAKVTHVSHGLIYGRFDNGDTSVASVNGPFWRRLPVAS